MAFRELIEGLKLPSGASERYRLHEGLERMLDGSLYDDLRYSFEQEKDANGNYIPLRKRRPSVDFNLAYEIVADTCAELFGDEQFPKVRSGNDASDGEISDLIDALDLERIMTDVYTAGVVGSVAVIVQRSDNGEPYFDVLPGRWCEPVYRSPISEELVALVVTYPVHVDEHGQITEDDKAPNNAWYRFVVGPYETVEYEPLADHDFARLGEDGIEFRERQRYAHGFAGRTPVVFIRNLGGKPHEIDGPALWWPVRNLCVEIDYTLSQCGRGLRYSADPMLFFRRGDMFDYEDKPAGYESSFAANRTEDGEMVKGATQTLVGGAGSDAKLLEISAAGITEERNFVRDLREYALEVLGGVRLRSEDMRGTVSGVAIDKSLKPLRRLVRRQRRPYGKGGLLALLDLVRYGVLVGALDLDLAVPVEARLTLEWPTDDTLQGAALASHVTALQLAAGGSIKAPVQLLNPEMVAAKLAADMGMHQSMTELRGTGVLEANSPQT